MSTPKSLKAFVRSQPMDCKICQLPEVIRTQILSRDTKRIHVPDVLAWLLKEYGVSIPRKEWVAHFNSRQGRHK